MPPQRCLPDRRIVIDTEWKQYHITFVAPANAQAGLHFFTRQPGSVWLDDVSMKVGQAALYRRDFDRGIVLLNYNTVPVQVALGSTYYRLRVPGSRFGWGPVTVETYRHRTHGSCCASRTHRRRSADRRRHVLRRGPIRSNPSEILSTRAGSEVRRLLHVPDGCAHAS